MTSITVTFDSTKNRTTIPFPVTVAEIGLHLFEGQGRETTNMTDENKQEFTDFVENIAPDRAVEEAKTIVSSAPAFDDILIGDLRFETTTTTVSFETDGF